jgi:rfaE bifunctional protein kinase chain/domain
VLSDLPDFARSPGAGVKVDRIEERAGGAANVARNAASLGAQVSLLSCVGADEAGKSLAHLLTGEGVAAHLLPDSSLATTVKLRVIGRQQQLLRIDFETTPDHEVLQAKLVQFKQMLAEHDVVVLSDYGKGGLTHIRAMIEAARAAGKKVLVDPKGDDYSRYRDASVLTPNRSELREVVGRWQDEADLEQRAQTLRAELGLEALLLTRSEEGMSLYREGEVLHQGALAREVFDVSGAGDTVIATLAVMQAAGVDLPRAMAWANRAAGIVVGKLGTAVVSRAELEI